MNVLTALMNGGIDGWMRANSIQQQPTDPKSNPKRKLVTLDDIRRQYQSELDRIACIENDQFSFTLPPLAPSSSPPLEPAQQRPERMDVDGDDQMEGDEEDENAIL